MAVSSPKNSIRSNRVSCGEINKIENFAKTLWKSKSLAKSAYLPEQLAREIWVKAAAEESIEFLGD